MASINTTTPHEHLWRSVAALASTATTMSENVHADHEAIGTAWQAAEELLGVAASREPSTPADAAVVLLALVTAMQSNVERMLPPPTETDVVAWRDAATSALRPLIGRWRCWITA